MLVWDPIAVGSVARRPSLVAQHVFPVLRVNCDEHAVFRVPLGTWSQHERGVAESFAPGVRILCCGDATRLVLASCEGLLREGPKAPYLHEPYR